MAFVSYDKRRELGQQQGSDSRPQSRKSAETPASPRLEPQLESAVDSPADNAIPISQSAATVAEDYNEPFDAKHAPSSPLKSRSGTLHGGNARRDVQVRPLELETPKKARRVDNGLNQDHNVSPVEAYADEDDLGVEMWSNSQGKSLRNLQKFPPKPPTHVARAYPDKARNSDNAPDVLSNWNQFLLSSQLSSGPDAQEIMNSVKTFFRSTGFHTPRSLVDISESRLDKIMLSVERGEQSKYRRKNGFNLRLQTCCQQMVNLSTETSKLKSGGDREDWKGTGAQFEMSNNSINVLKMLGTGPMAHTLMNTMNAVKVTPRMIPSFLERA